MYFVCVILFCYVIATSTAAGMKPRSVNVNLETVVQFNPEDISEDVKFLDTIQHFLDKVRTAVDSNGSVRSQTRQEINNELTNFIINTLEILKTYSDEDLKDVVKVFDNEFRKYNYEGCKFHELVENSDLRRFVASKFSTVQDQNGKDIKKSLSKILTALKYANFFRKYAEILDYINSLYGQNDVGKMKSFLNEIEAYKVKSKRANLDLHTIVRNGVRGIIFDHYSNLNPDARRELKIKIASFWNNAVITTETTSRKNMFGLANSFNFLKDLTWQIIAPEKSTTRTVKEINNSQEFKDLTRQNTNTSPEEMSEQTDDKESKSRSSEKSEKNNHLKKNKEHKRNRDKHNKKAPVTVADKRITNISPEEVSIYSDREKLKDKRKEKKHKKNKEHKRKKDSHNKKAHPTVVDEYLAPERKHASNKHKSEHEFRKHDARPANGLDYEAVVNVRGQTDQSNSNELQQSGESVSFAR